MAATDTPPGMHFRFGRRPEMLDGDRRVRAIDDLTIADGQNRFADSVDDTTIG